MKETARMGGLFLFADKFILLWQQVRMKTVNYTIFCADCITGILFPT